MSANLSVTTLPFTATPREGSRPAAGSDGSGFADSLGQAVQDLRTPARDTGRDGRAVREDRPEAAAATERAAAKNVDRREDRPAERPDRPQGRQTKSAERTEKAQEPARPGTTRASREETAVEDHADAEGETAVDAAAVPTVPVDPALLGLPAALRAVLTPKTAPGLSDQSGQTPGTPGTGAAGATGVPTTQPLVDAAPTATGGTTVPAAVTTAAPLAAPTTTATGTAGTTEAAGAAVTGTSTGTSTATAPTGRPTPTPAAEGADAVATALAGATVTSTSVPAPGAGAAAPVQTVTTGLPQHVRPADAEQVQTAAGTAPTSLPAAATTTPAAPVVAQAAVGTPAAPPQVAAPTAEGVPTATVPVAPVAGQAGQGPGAGAGDGAGQQQGQGGQQPGAQPAAATAVPTAPRAAAGEVPVQAPPVVLAGSPAVTQPIAAPVTGAAPPVPGAVTADTDVPAGLLPTAVPSVTGTGTVTAPAAAVASTPPAPLPLANPAAFAHGVAGRLEDLPAADAVHRMSVEVNPQGLGPVKVTAEVSGGALHVSLAGASEAARHALKAAVGDLQRELSGGAWTQTTVDVRADSGSSQQGRSADAQFGGRDGSSSGQQGSGQGAGQRSAAAEAGASARSAFSAAAAERRTLREAAAVAAGRVDLSV
ncbi:flagellar hook-length control protein FliK [Kineococcus sp. TBRC 1896]|uniref:Flagellar hook-length control protein FliK n=1 Tax=Kineococcus mangrovi TaxID=1660183 RepID=A0ABV4I7N1_9ACTN